MKRMVTMRTFNLYVLLIVATCVSITSAGVHGNSEVPDADKYAYIGEMLKNNLRLTKQLWNIGLAAASNSSTGSGLSPFFSFGNENENKKNVLSNLTIFNCPHTFSEPIS
jgi:predicted small lipoprotein YifL